MRGTERMENEIDRETPYGLVLETIRVTGVQRDV